MNQSICPQCETLNRADEVVCFKCGAVLEEQRRPGSRVRVFRDYHSSQLGWVHRIFAAVWFAGTAVAPIFLLISIGFARNDDQFGSFFLFGVPVLLAAAAGFSIGAKILDRSKTHSGLMAAWKGALTAGVSFIVYIMFLSVVGDPVIRPETRDTVDLLTLIAVKFVLYLLFGSIMVGWLTLIAGAIGGALLFAFSNLPSSKTLHPNFAREAHPTKGLVALVSVLFVFASCIVPIGINLISTRRQQANSIRQFQEMQRLQSAMDNDLELLRSKLAAGADPNFPEVPSGPLLEAAAINGQKKVVKLLLEYGADPNLRSDHGWPPVVSAARDTDTQILYDLIQAGADVNQATNDGWTALMNAATNINVEGVEMLLRHGASINARSQEGKTALGYVKERKEMYFTGKADTSPNIKAEAKAHDNVIALLERHGGHE